MSANSLNMFFDHIYVITLQRAKDRHVHLARELEGIDYSIFWGRDNREFDSDMLEKNNIYNATLAKRHNRYGKAMSKGQIGCSWSHRLVYEDILLHNYTNALILEDDIVINKKAMTLLPAMMQQLPADWELLYLGFDKHEQAPANAGIKKVLYHFLHSLGLLKLSHKTIAHLYPQKISPYIYLSGYHDCTHAYAITAEGARKLIDLQTPVSFVADHLLAYAGTNQLLKSYLVQPRVIDQLYQVMNENGHSYVRE